MQTIHLWIQARQISTRVRDERLDSDKASHVHKYLASSKACRDSCSTECFTALDSATLRFNIKMKEAFHNCLKNGPNQLLTDSYNMLSYLFQFIQFQIKLQRTFLFKSLVEVSM